MVQSVPTTFIMYNQDIIDVLVGVPNEERLKEFYKIAEMLYELDKPVLELEALIKSNVSKIEQGDIKEGIAGLQGILVKKDLLDRQKAMIGSLIADGYYRLKDMNSFEEHLKKAQEYSKSETPDEDTSKLIINLSTKLLEYKAKDTPIGQTSNNLKEVYDIAVQLLRAGKHEECAEHCLNITKVEKNWEEGKAKQLIIEAISSDRVSKEFAKSTRRKLASILFG